MHEKIDKEGGGGEGGVGGWEGGGKFFLQEVQIL